MPNFWGGVSVGGDASTGGWSPCRWTHQMSVATVTGSRWTTSGATNSGVPNMLY